MRRLSQRLSLAAVAAWPLLAVATVSCPPEYGEKSAGFWALGFCVLGVFVLIGLAIPILAIRITRGRRVARRMAWTLAACVPMLGLWLAGLLVFVEFFTLRC
ncbi:hypothetical protein IEQ11_18725 [Lysobacter capsici]|uniref:hypothetical protein n=1 Tax=Lysobacter capsici TaxID=435897 RepID=UPI0017859447|nr:hypothetical protein [Lysobacter capsici]UOF13757.1 hypothetical protein IEQ11_18725 [Lysobacter capsici]